MFANLANAGTWASTAAPSCFVDVKFDPSRWADATFDFTYPPPCKSEIDINQLVEGVSSLNISKKGVNDRSPNLKNTTPPPTPPRRRESLQQSKAQKYETSYDSDTSAYSDPGVRVHRRSSSSGLPRAVRTNPNRLSRRSQSPPTSPFLPSPPSRSQILCSAPTKQGSPCQRSTIDGRKGWRCHNHRGLEDSRPKSPSPASKSKSVLPKVRPDGVFRYDSSEWIPSYLQPKTQQALRDEMGKPPTQFDEPGYVYAFERRGPEFGDSGDLNPFTIKVGRARSGGDNENLASRRKNCRACFSRDGCRMVERGWWPGNIDRNSLPSYTANSTGSYIDSGNVGPEGKYCHKVERLVLLELGDVARNSVHLVKGFAEQSTAALGKLIPSEGPSIARPLEGPKPEKKFCLECRKTHNEVFNLKRIAGHDMTGKEWETVVLPIIERWGRFVTVFGGTRRRITWE